MAIQEIELGTAPTGADGDVARAAFEKVNANFSELDQRADQAQASAEAGQQAALEAQQAAAGAAQASQDNATAISGLGQRVTELEDEPVGQVDSVAGVVADGGRNVPAAELIQALGVDTKVDKVDGKQLSDSNFTDAEKAKLAALESSHFRGVFASLAALQTAIPVAAAGDYADVDAGVGSSTGRFLWDPTDNEWQAIGSGAPLTAAQIKQLYESNPDTNAYTGAEKAKLQGVAPSATANPDTDSLAEGATRLYFSTARVRNTLLAGLVAGANAVILATDNILQALAKLQAQVSAKLSKPIAEPTAANQVPTWNGTEMVWQDGGGRVYLTPVGPAGALAVGQTSVPVAGGYSGKVLGFVVRNGIVISEWTATDGTNVVLTNAIAATDEELTFFVFEGFAVANALPATGKANDSDKLNGLQASAYAQLANLPISKAAISNPLTWTAGGQVTFAHELGAAPKIVQVFAVSTAVLGSYPVGTIWAIGYYYTGSILGGAQPVDIDATNVVLRCGAVMSRFTASNAALDYSAAQCQLIVRAFA